MRTNNSYIELKVFKTIEQDVYNDGCIPETFQDLGECETFKVYDHNPLNLIDELKERGYENLSLFGPFLLSQRIEDSNGNQANNVLIERWKQGKVVLYSASYQIKITTVIRTNWSKNKLKEHFADLEEN